MKKETHKLETCNSWALIEQLTQIGTCPEWVISQKVILRSTSMTPKGRLSHVEPSPSLNNWFFFARPKPARFFPFWFFWIFEYLWSYDNTWIGWKVERHFGSEVIAMQQRGSVGFLALVCSEGVWGYAYARIRSSSSYGMYSNVSISYRRIWRSQSERTEEFQKERDSVSTRFSSSGFLSVPKFFRY